VVFYRLNGFGEVNVMFAIGLDIGTTHIKAALLDEMLNVLNLHVEDNQKSYSTDNGWTYDPELLWSKTLNCIRKVVENIDGNEIAAIGVTSMAEAGLPVDKHGIALFPLIPWNDMRAEAQMNTVQSRIDGFKLYRKTGLVCHPKYSLFKIIWFKENHRDLFDKTAVWLSVADYIIYRLCGNYATDESLAGRTMLFNIVKKEWDQDIVKYIGRSDILPKVVPLGSTVGVIQGCLAKDLGINGCAKIAAAGQDHLSAAYANCLSSEGEVLDSMGTSEVFVGIEDRPNLNCEAYKLGINQGCFIDGKYFWMTSLPAFGASVEWLKSLISVNGDHPYDMFENLEKGPEPGALYYFPYLNGSGTPHVDHSKRGMLIGLSIDTDARDLIKSIYEGTCYESRWIIETIEKAKLIKIERIKAVGGALKNTSWISIKSNIFGRDIMCSALEQDSAVGAAVMGARSAGKTEFVNNLTLIKTSGAEYTADKEIHKKYNRKFLEYKNIYESMENYNERSELFESNET
jgi:xylulokinase